jgi:hypothetical protein
VYGHEQAAGNGPELRSTVSTLLCVWPGCLYVCWVGYRTQSSIQHRLITWTHIS